MAARVCNVCEDVLVLGSNWPPSAKKFSRYTCSPCHTAYRKDWASKRPEKEKDQRRHNHFKRMYGITLDDFNAMLEDQKGLCKVCGVDIIEKFNVDHNHTTGLVRGVLCWACNIGIGKFQDDPELLKNAAKYLEETDGNN